MKNELIFQTLSVALMLFLFAGITIAADSGLGEKKVDWPAFMQQHDMTFDKLPSRWQEAPHFGNALIGSMLYQVGDTIRLQVFRADVHDHRDDSYGWPAYSRAHFQIGHFSLHPVGKLTGCSWRKDLWNGELTGTIKTDKGEIEIRHFTHAEDMAIVTELTASEGEQGCRWTWHPIEARTSRGGYPTKESEIGQFAKKYGSPYANTLKVFKVNPAGRQEKKGNVSVWIQDLLAGGQYATAWSEKVQKETRRHIVSIANSYPKSIAGETAVSDVKRFVKLNSTRWTKAHRNWWHNYYTRSFITIPDKSLESLYWQTMYRFGCTSRTGRYYIDCPGIWFQGGPWAYTTTDWNIQCAHWSVYAANRLEQGQELLDRFHSRREELIKAVRPVEWQKDSAYLPIEVAGDLIGNREQDMRYFHLVGTLPWTMNNFWSQYRYSMDDEMLREKIYPMLRRSINLYFHMVEKGDDGKLHLQPTYSPETGVHKDCNFDLALFKWGCYTLLKASKRLGIDDPLIPRWKGVVKNLVDFPADENGFRLGSETTSSPRHRHFSNLLMIYPLYLVNIEQEGTMEVLKKSYDRAHSINGLPAMVQSHAGPIGAVLGQGDQVLEGLKRLQGNLYPNGMWFTNPCLESSLGMANIVQNMLIQSWTDPAADESGPIRIFPAIPSAWKDVEFRDLRTEGAFLVSAKRTAGQTQWVRIKSLAGEPCRVKPGLDGEVRIKSNGKRKLTLKKVSPGIYEIDMKKGDEVLLYTYTANEKLVAASSSPRIVNIINFIRQCEPRIDWIMEDVLYETVVEQIKIMKKHQLKGTFLLQYDALMDIRYQQLLKGLPADMFEIGVWWEIPQPLVENSGYKWRGRYRWDWHADVGFATGYSPKERVKLVDTYMADFKKIFGYYPKSVGSWFIDAHTLQYMYDRYDIAASCNCKDQIGTDGYTMWGGYWNQGYYPSKKNAYMPAQNAENQIPVPIFRMLGSDPIHQYDSGLGGNRQRVVSLEPVYERGGGDADWCQWYFDAFVDGAAMGYGYTQAGQENSFTWKRMSQGFKIQMPMIARLLKEGRIAVQTLGETGKWFKDNYRVTPPTSVTVLNDHSKKKQKTVWFNSRFYRANLLWDQGAMRFRDIHLFDESVASDYLTKRGTSTKCNYYTLPVVDGFRWSTLENVAGLRLKSAGGLEIKGGTPTVDDRTDGELTVRWPINSPEGEIGITFNETSVSIWAEGGMKDNWFLELSSDKKAKLPFGKIDRKKLSCTYKNTPYSISAIQGAFTNEPGSGLRIIPENQRIVLDFSIR